MKNYVFQKDGINCISSDDLCSYGGCNKGKYIYIGKLVEKLAAYEKLGTPDELKEAKEFAELMTKVTIR